MGHSRRDLLKRFVSVPAVLAARSVSSRSIPGAETTTVVEMKEYGTFEQAWISDGQSAAFALAYHLEAMCDYVVALEKMPGIPANDRLWETITPIGGDPASWQYDPSTNAITRLRGPAPKGATVRFVYHGSHLITD